MKFSIFTGLFSMVLIVSCTQQNNKESFNVKNHLLPVPGIAKNKMTSKDTVYSLKTNGDTLVLDLQMDTIGQHHYIAIDIQRGKDLYGQLSSENRMANIRFTQIQMPDSTLDGPFGSDLQYKIKYDGIYRLNIGENQMAGDPWKGKFTLKAWVK